MFINKNLNIILLFGIFFLNILAMIPSLQDDNVESDEFFPALLRGFGFKSQKREPNHQVPRLLSSSQVNQSYSDRMHFAQSEYYVPGWADTRWSYRKNITIDHNKVDADLTNFPVYIELYDSDLQQDAQASGNDILFTNASGHLLDHEIEVYDRVYNSSYAHLIAWVEANISSSQDTILSMYYGNPTAVDQSNPLGVWDDNFAGVWHLNEDPSASSPQFYDASSNSNEGTAGGAMTSGDQVEGVSGNGIDFDGVDDHINVSDDPSLDITDEITLEAWVYYRGYSLGQRYGKFVHKSLSSVTDPWTVYSLHLDDTMGDNANLRFQISTGLVGSALHVESTSIVALNGWTHVVGTYDGSTMRIYIDGVDENQLSTSITIGTNDNPVQIGNWPLATDNRFKGIIDEVRISSVARSAAWIETEYNNQYDPNTFYSIDSEEKYSDAIDWHFPGLRYRKGITIDASEVSGSGSLSNFPILIDLYDTDLHHPYKAQADGDDILFSDINGTLLDYEIELFDQDYDTTNAHLVAWVEIPSLSGTDDTRIFMYFGNSGMDTQANPGGVWDSNYVGVWHLNQNPSGTPPQIKDSTSPATHGTVYGSMTSNDLVSGVIGEALNFDGTEDFIDFGNPSEVRITGALTVETWFCSDSDQNEYIISKNGPGPANRSWDLSFDPHNTTHGSLVFRYDTDGVLPHYGEVDNVYYEVGQWHHVVGVYSPSTYLRMYLNGQLVYDNSTAASSQYDAWNPLRFGARGDEVTPDDTPFYDGKIDEARVSNIARPSEWVITGYNNQDDPNGFYSVDSIEIQGNWTIPYLRYKKTLTINSSEIAGIDDLLNFPVIVDLYDSDLHSADKAQADGDDIAFSDVYGARLDHEIELFDQTGNGTHAHLIAWVEVPVLKATTDTEIYMWYGNNAVSSLTNSGGVWNDYGGVWHLHDDFLDSSSNNNDGTNYQSSDVGAKIADGQDFDGTDDYINVGSGSSIDDIFDGGATISVWIYPEGWGGGDYGRILDKSTATNGANGWVLCVDGEQSSAADHHLLFFRDYDTNPNQGRGLWYTPEDSISLNQWQHIVVTFDESSDTNVPTIYINGIVQTLEEEDNSQGTVVSDAAQSLYIGRNIGGGRTFDGALDEVRLSTKIRSIEWVQTEYKNQLNPESFISIGSEKERQWYDATFSYNKDIILNNSQVAGELSDFPILLNITDADFKSGKLNSDASDILFIDPIGNKLAHDIESFTQTGSNGHLVAWVSVPHLFSEEKTIITMYYRNSQIGNQENPAGVWEDYGGVWHLNEDPNDTAPQFPDSTSNNNDGTTAGTAGTLTQVSGQMDGSILFPYTNQDNLINISDDNSLQFSSDFWISIWVNTNDSASDVDVVLAKWGPSAPNQNYFLGKLGASSTFEFLVDSSENVAIDISKINDGSWHYVVGVADSSSNQLRLYVDGVLEGTDAYDGSSATDTTSLWLGRNPGAGVDQAWSGGLDECRLSSIIHSENWIDTEYNNQFNPVSFHMTAQEFSLDVNPPMINNFGVEDLGTGIGKFWADITDIASDVDTVTIKINGTEYSMSFNGTYWIYQKSVVFNGYYEFQIANTSDIRGNFITSPSSMKQTTFTEDNVLPDVIHWKYYQIANSFKSNVTDSWGEIHTVILNVTYMGGQSRNNITAVMRNYQNFTGNLLGYINDTLMMPNGEINFKIFVNDTAGNSFTSTEHQGNVFVNHPPVASDLTLSRSDSQVLLPVFSNCTLYLDYAYSDEDSHAEAGTEIRWYKNSVLQTDYNDTTTIPASELFKGDDWNATVKPKDGQLFGDLVTSSTVTIVNTPPNIQTLTLSPSVAYATSTLQITNTTTDYENDPITTYYVEWYCNSIHNSSYDNLYSLTPEKIAKGETWYCKLRAFDGTDNSSWATSNSILIQNTVPLAVNLSLTLNPTTTDVLIADWDMQDDDTEDTENKAAAIVYWYNDGQLQSHLTNLTVVNPSNTSKNEWWHFVVQVYDGEDYSSPTELLPHIKILNTPPAADNASITTSNPRTNDDLAIDWDYQDVDNDPAGTPIIKWYLNNNYQSIYDGYDTLPSSATTKGNNWHFGIQVYDGSNYSSQVNSSQVTIQNSSPEVDNLGITAAPTTTDNLVTSWDSSDNDTGDSLTYTVIWFLNGVEQAPLENETTIGAGNTTKGELWSFSVQIHDGTDSSPMTSLGYNVTILNTAPIVGNLTLTANPTTTTDLIANFDSFDEDPADSGSLLFIIQWFKNGQEMSSLANQTTIGSGNTSKNQVWWYTVKANDGETNSSTAESEHIQILNTVPVIGNLTITTNPVTTTDLVADWDELDADGDSLSYTTRWYIVGQGLQSTYNDLDTVPSSATTKGETWYFNITAFDGNDYSTEEKSPETTILNSAPEVNNLAITTNPTTTDDLLATWVETDNDTGDSLTQTVVWFLNGIEQAPLENETTVGAGNTTKGQLWSFSVQIHDGTDSSSMTSLGYNVTILNTAPIVENLTLIADPTTTTDLIANFDSSDEDPTDDGSLVFIIQWFKNGQEMSSLANETTIGSGNTSKTEFWWYTVKANDGEANSSTAESPHVQILNSAPIIENLTITVNPVTTTDLIADWDELDADGDSLSFTIRWYIVGQGLQSSYNNLDTVPSSATSKGETWYYNLTAFDESAYSTEEKSPETTILNSAPEVTDLEITVTNPTTVDDLVASWNDTDADGDSLTFIISWYQDGSEQLPLANTTIVEAGNTTKGEEWHFKVRAWDGETYSGLVSLASNATILNSKPIVTNPTFNNTSPTTDDDFNITYTFSDADPGDSEDPGKVIVYWYVNWVYKPEFQNYTIIYGENTTADQVWYYKIRVYDGEDYCEGNVTSIQGITIEGVAPPNDPPKTLDLTLTPSNPKTHQSLVANYTYFDNNSDPEVAFEIRWYENTVLVPVYNNLFTVPFSTTTKGDEWYFTVRVFDGQDWSLQNTSITVIIENSEPEVNSLGLTAAPTTTDDLVATWVETDNDTGDSLTYTVVWFLNGIEQAPLENETTVGAGNTTKGQLWSFSVQIHDGTDSSLMTSLGSNVTILNTAPIVGNLTLTADPTTTTDLIANFDSSDEDPADSGSLLFIILWFKNGQEMSSLANQTTIQSGNTSKNQVWWYTVKANDGEANSSTAESEHVQILNSAPIIENLTITTNPVTTNDLVADWDELDADGDSLSYTIRWYIVGQGLQSTYDNLDTVPSSATSKGETWYFNITAFDGNDYSTEEKSPETTILNSAPEVNNLAITTSPATTDDLVTSWDSSDNDIGDSLTYTVIWFLNGIEQAPLENETTVGAGNTTKGQLWSFSVQIHDGTDSSSMTSLGSNVTILNTAPIVGNLTLTADPTTTTDLIANFDSSDEDPADSGSLLFIILWFKNGQEMSSLANQTTIQSGNTSKNQVWWYTVKANDGEANSSTAESEHVQILNSAPIIENLTITTNPVTKTDLVADWDELDADGDSLSYTIRWYIVGQGLQSTYNDLDTVPSSATTKGETWYFNITAFDGNDYSTEEKSPETAILNSAPEVNNLAITTNPTTIDDLVTSWNDTDVDGDSLTYALTWYVGGIEQPSLANKIMIESGNTTKGDLWTFTVEIFDGTTSSQASLGYNITIINSAPYAGNLTLTPSVGTLDDLIADWDYSDDDNDPRNDNLAHICWFKNGNNQTLLTDQKYVNSTETVKNEVWWFIVRVHDGTTFSISQYESEHIQIQNTAPINSSSLPIPTNPTVETGLILTESAILTTLIDADGDIIQFITSIRWFKASIIQPDLNGSLNVPNYRLTKGEVWYYTILPSDGLDEGSICISSNIEVQNSIPVVNLAYFAESSVTTIHNLTASFLYEDADGESISVSGIRWYRSTDTSAPYTYNLVPIYNGNLSLPNAATNKNERWKFDIKITDCYNESISWIISDYIEIQNSEPWIDPFSIELTGGVNTSDPLLVNFSWYDNDPEDNSTGTTIVWENSGIYYDETTDTSLDASNTKAGERWWVTVKPYDGSSWGASVNSKLYGISIIIGNSAPEIKQADIAIKGEFNGSEFSGASYGTLFNLILYYNATDIDGDQGITAFGLNLADGYALGSEYRWYRNRSGTVTIISPLNNKITVPWYETREGDTWWVQIRPRDLYGDFGIPKNSTPIAIGNTAPQVSDYYWIELSYFTTNDLSFLYTFFDYDTDDFEQGLNIEWYRNGFHLPVLDDEAIIPSHNTTKGETWYVRIQVWDGEDYSEWYNLTDIIILNSAPLANNILLIPSSPYTTADLVATWNFTDSDGDSENVTSAIIEWYRNGEYVGSFTSVTASLTNRGERWYFTISVTDGYNYSVNYQSNTITIMNSAPTVTSLLINNGSILIYTTNSLDVIWESDDIDSIDVESSRLIVWYMNGVIQPQLTNLSSVPPSYVIKGQEWQVAIAVKDTGGLWSDTVFSSLVLISNSKPSIFIYNTSHPEFIVEDELLEINPNWYLYTDADGDENDPSIYWYVDSIYAVKFNNQTSIPANETHPGEVWYYVIQPFDGTVHGDNRTSAMISIESRPQINSIIITPLTDIEGHYTIDVNTTDSKNNIQQVEFLLTLNGSETLAPFVITSPISNGATVWRLDYILSSYSYLDTSVSVVVTVITTVNYTITYEIREFETITYDLEDKAPPRVNEAWFVHDVNPINITFYAEIEEFGSGISQIILYYSFIPANDSGSPSLGGLGSNLLQQEHQVQMVWHNETADSVLYHATIPFNQNGTSWKIIYRISTMDNNGNEDPYAFDILRFPERLGADIIPFTPRGIDPTLMIIVVAITVLLAVMGSIVYVKFIRKPEIVGLDKELVLGKISNTSESEVMAALDSHTIGAVVSFFDQRHGPIPIIVIPELLKDNFSKLVDLSDRSFSGTGFCDNFDAEITSSYDFVLTQGIRIKAMSFGYALERPQARGGQENITCNILVHQDLFPLVNQFLDEIQVKVHAIHLLMDKDPSNKDEIRKKVIGLRKYVSSIVLSYEHIYGTTELVSEEN